nr:hypothetical protein [Tanacetum cinerariifolium]
RHLKEHLTSTKSVYLSSSTLPNPSRTQRVNIDYARLIWEDIINKLNKKTREKVVLYLRFLSLLLEHKMEGQKKGGPSTKETSGSKVGHSVKETLSSLTKDTNPSQPPASTPVVDGLHKEDQQANGGPTSLRVTRHYASTTSIAEADLGKSYPHDLVFKQQGIVKGTKTISFDHIIARTNPSVVVDKTKSARNELKTTHTEIDDEPVIIQDEEEEEDDDAEKNQKLEKLKTKAKAGVVFLSAQPSYPNVEQLIELLVDFMDLDSPEDDEPVIIQDEEEEEDDDAEKNQKLEKLKTKAKAGVVFLSAQPSYPNVEQLIELLVKSLTPELSKLLTSHDFTNSLPTELKELSSKFNDLTWEIRKLKKPRSRPWMPSKSSQQGQAGTHPAVREKNKTEVTITYPLKSSPQTEGELIKKDKGKKDMSFKDVEKEDTRSDSDEDANLTGSMVETSKKKKLKKFEFITEGGRTRALEQETRDLDVEINHKKNLKASYGPNHKRTDDEEGVPFSDNGTDSGSPSENDDEYGATSIEENAHPKGNPKNLNPSNKNEIFVNNDEEIDRSDHIDYDDVEETDDPPLVNITRPPRKGLMYVYNPDQFVDERLGYSDSNWAKCPKTRKSASGYCVFINGCSISWKN